MNEEIRYETYIKLDNGKWHFTGWCKMTFEEFCIETKVRGSYMYKTYKWLNGNIEEYRYKIK